MKDGEAQKTSGPGAAPDEAVFNGTELLTAFLGDTEMAVSLLSRFIERSAAHIASFPALENEKNWEEARRFAHTLKGSAMTLSGKELGAAAARLERLYKAALDAAIPETAALEAARALVEETFGRFRDQAETFIKTRRP